LSRLIRRFLEEGYHGNPTPQAGVGDARVAPCPLAAAPRDPPAHAWLVSVEAVAGLRGTRYAII
jgi:hypothetical protein